jgi:hypothetical protein
MSFVCVFALKYVDVARLMNKDYMGWKFFKKINSRIASKKFKTKY